MIYDIPKGVPLFKRRRRRLVVIERGFLYGSRNERSRARLTYVRRIDEITTTTASRDRDHHKGVGNQLRSRRSYRYHYLFRVVV